MSINAAIEASTNNRARILEIRAELAEQKRAWFADGISTERVVRATLEAELARLEQQSHALITALRAAKEAAVQAKKTTFLHLLVQKVTQAGWPELVEDARRESLAAIESSGLLPAYQLPIK